MYHANNRYGTAIPRGLPTIPDPGIPFQKLANTDENSRVFEKESTPRKVDARRFHHAIGLKVSLCCSLPIHHSPGASFAYSLSGANAASGGDVPGTPLLGSLTL